MERLRELIMLPRYVLKELKQVDPGLMAAAVAYNAFFALVPLAIAGLAILGFVGRSEDAIADARATLTGFVPDDIADFLIDVVEDAERTVNAGQGVIVILVSLAIALYAGSRGVIAMQRALRQMEDIDETRPAPVIYLVGIGLTVGAGLLLVLALAAFLVGSEVVEFLSEFTGVGLIDTLWGWVTVPLTVLVLYLFMFGLYHFGPPKPLPVTWVAALAATVAALLASWGFGWYLDNFSLGSTYGLLGTFAVALLWLYIIVYAVLYAAGLIVFGTKRGRRELAEMQAEIAEKTVEIVLPD